MIPEEIIKNHGLKSYKNNWLRGLIELPNRSFYHFFKESQNGNFVFNTTIQNYSNEEEIDMFLNSIDEILIDKDFDFEKLNKKRIKSIAHFDHIIVAPFDYTLIPNSSYPDFDKKRVNIYPIYDFELNGNESKKDIKTITKKVLSTTEWNREPSPLIRYKFTNPKHKYGTVGKSLVIDKEENVYAALSKFETNDCLMEVQNHLTENIIITFLEKEKSIKISADEELILPLEKAIDYLKYFFRK